MCSVLCVHVGCHGAGINAHSGPRKVHPQGARYVCCLSVFCTFWYCVCTGFLLRGHERWFGLQVKFQWPRCRQFFFRGTTSTRSEPFEVIMFCCAGWKQVFILQKPMSSHVHSAKTYECVCPFCKNLCLAHAFFKNLWMLQQVGTQSRSWQRNSNLLLCCGASGSLHVVHACW